MGDPQQGARACCRHCSANRTRLRFSPRIKKQKIYVSLEGGGGEKVNTQRAHGALGIGEEAFPQPPLLSPA